MTSPTPSALLPLHKGAPRLDAVWFRFFASLGAGSPPPAAQPVTVSASPFTFTAPGRGALAITGGTVSALSMTRGRVSLVLPATAALLPLGKGDAVQVTFIGATKLTFLPT